MTAISPLHAATIALGMSLLAAPAAMAQASACASPGTFAFSNVTLGSKDFLPSMSKQFAAAGLMAQRNNCTVDVICPRAGDSEVQSEQAATTCRAARDIVVRGGSAASFSFDDVKNNRPSPGNGMSAGNIYIIVK